MGLVLYLQVLLVRTLTHINNLIDRYLTSPAPLHPAFTVTIPARLSPRPGTISLYFYLPRGHTRSSLSRSSSKKELPLIVNFHGGGFTIGHATDDSRWATTLLEAVPAVFVSVGYRMGPEHPQPTAVEDCVDAVRWLRARADDFGFDATRTILTGFSAGGNLCFTVPLRHFRERKAEVEAASNSHSDSTSNSTFNSEDGGTLSGIVAFYPSVNQATPRQQKIDENPLCQARGSEPAWLHRMFDGSYYQNLPPEGRASLDLSPALAPAEDLRTALPQRMAIFTCEWDKLLTEGEEFKTELKGLGKVVGGNMVAGVEHAFDKKPGGRGRNVGERDRLYRDAVAEVRGMV